VLLAPAGALPIAGRWLEEVGISIGSGVSVVVFRGCLLLELAPPKIENKFPPPPRTYISERIAMTVVHRRAKAAIRPKQGVSTGCCGVERMSALSPVSHEMPI
jgi:hypothetical protein